jgi:hypothetical protein
VPVFLIARRLLKNSWTSVFVDTLSYLRYILHPVVLPQLLYQFRLNHFLLSGGLLQLLLDPLKLFILLQLLLISSVKLLQVPLPNVTRTHHPEIFNQLLLHEPPLPLKHLSLLQRSRPPILLRNTLLKIISINHVFLNKRKVTILPIRVAFKAEASSFFMWINLASLFMRRCLDPHFTIRAL